MSVWGIGAYYKNAKQKDQSAEFVNRGKAYSGWNKTEAPAIEAMLASLKCGDIVYVKSFSPKTKTLFIKAVGIVIGRKGDTYEDLGYGIPVSWKENFSPFSIEVTEEMYRNNVFANTVYEEYNEQIILRLISELLG